MEDWEKTLKHGEPVNVSLFDLVADIHDVDVYTLEPQRHGHTDWVVYNALHGRAPGENGGCRNMGAGEWVGIIQSGVRMTR